MTMGPIRITERDKAIINALYKFRVLTIQQISILVDFKSYYTARNRLQKLVRNGYCDIVQKRPFIENYYVLKDRSFNEIDKSRIYYKVNLGTLEHELGVATIACWLKDEYDLEIDDFQTDRELKYFNNMMSFSHEPDLKIDKLEMVVEYERSQKRLADLHNNLLANDSLLTQQLWVVDKRRPKMRKGILEWMEIYNIKGDVLYMEHIKEKVNKLCHY